MRRAIERNDTHVHHLGPDRDEPGYLQNLIAIIVGLREHRAGHTAGDAPAIHAHILDRVGTVLNEIVPPLLGLRPQGDATIRGITDERCSAAGDNLMTGTEPELIDRPCAPAGGQGLGAWSLGRVGLRATLDGPTFGGGRFFFRKEFGPANGPFKRCDRRIVPEAL